MELFTNRNFKLRENNGFTLIEILVTVVVLVILAAIATPILLGQINKAKDQTAKTNIENTRQLIADTRGVSGEAKYAKNLNRVSVTMSAGITPNDIAGAGQITLPFNGILYSDGVQLNGPSEQTINLENFCIQDTGIHTFHMNGQDTETSPGPCV